MAQGCARQTLSRLRLVRCFDPRRFAEGVTFDSDVIKQAATEKIRLSGWALDKANATELGLFMHELTEFARSF
jgi:hypothetical protein